MHKSQPTDTGQQAAQVLLQQGARAIAWMKALLHKAQSTKSLALSSRVVPSEKEGSFGFSGNKYKVNGFIKQYGL
ncbi:MAG: hypothetical protein HC862_01110 [Scytonema sp. RU_4_4]|nr:hypothetical protein [Scytonema sp. RU_4_4]